MREWVYYIGIATTSLILLSSNDFFSKMVWMPYLNMVQCNILELEINNSCWTREYHTFGHYYNTLLIRHISLLLDIKIASHISHFHQWIGHHSSLIHILLCCTVNKSSIHTRNKPLQTTWNNVQLSDAKQRKYHTFDLYSTILSWISQISIRESVSFSWANS